MGIRMPFESLPNPIQIVLRSVYNHFNIIENPISLPFFHIPLPIPWSQWSPHKVPNSQRSPTKMATGSAPATETAMPVMTWTMGQICSFLMGT